MDLLKIFIQKYIKRPFTNFKAIKIFVIELLIIFFCFGLFDIPVMVSTVLITLPLIPLLNIIYLLYKDNISDEKAMNWNNASTLAVWSFISIIIITFLSSPVFLAHKYGSLLKIENVKANKIFVENPDKIRKVSQKMAVVKANKILGVKIKGIELNTQFELSKGSIIKYKGKEIWVFPLQYSDSIKWLFNKNIPGYVIVSATNPDAKAVFINKPFKYSPSACLLDNIKRIALIKNFLQSVSIHFEIDNKGNPYWVVSNLKYKFFGNLFKIASVDVVNAKTGKVLNDVPKWVDKTIPEWLADEYISYFGKYRHNSFWSYLFIGKNVFVPTNYHNRELWLIENKKDNGLKWFTGLTSQNKKDNSLTGAILMDTKSLKGYIIDDASGVTDEQGAINSIDAKLGANGVKWQSVLPMPFIINKKWYWTASIVDKNTNLYQKEGAVQGKNITNVYFGKTLKNIILNHIDVLNVINKKGKFNKRYVIYRIKYKIRKIQKELKELNTLVNSLQSK